MMIARKISVRITTTEPVRFKYSDSAFASHSPAYPPALNGLPARSSVPNTRLRNALMQANRRVAPVALVPAASTSRHQNECHPMPTSTAGMA
jgi:hypothetical protein